MVDIGSRIMAGPDPFLDVLKQLGFLPVAMPRADLQPLTLFSRRGKELNLLGDLAEALAAPAASKPEPVRDLHTAASVQQTRATKLASGLGLSVLGNILGALTGSRCELKAGFEHAATMDMEFSGITIDRVDVVKLDRYLSRGAIHPDCRAIREQMIKGECGVITAVMRCARYVVSAQRADGSRLGLDLPLLQQTAGARVEVSAANADCTRVAYEGPVPLAFGVQAIRIFYDRLGRFTAFEPVGAGSAMVLGWSAPVRRPAPFPVEGSFVELAA